ncbi:MAG: hypothetical protein KC414_14015, partial [Romboutsia sp.]|nr:hypothetical protein [Romboutsia sp.]
MEKIIITGTGRSGTTFLMILLTFLGLDTGFTKNNFNKYISPKCNSGMEFIKLNKKQKIIKYPGFTDKFDEIIKHTKI